MTEAISFQTRARAIDHLGRGQIADAPTAVSELWKNAFDAYARNVSLHIFDEEAAIAAIFDDGVGMSREDVLERWLVIGTESKVADYAATNVDTLGLPPRIRQGEKGIGRLSVAFLAPATILLTKRKGGAFVAVIVDWRLFENPFLMLDDIKLPVAEFSDSHALLAGLSGMLATLKSNLGGSDDERSVRLAAGWKKFSAFEKATGATDTATAIAAAWTKQPLTAKHLEQWLVFAGLAEHGTAMFMLDLNTELAVWVRPRESGEEVEMVKDRLRQTLTNFIDPYAETRPEFDYEVFVHRGGQDQRIIAANDVFGRDSLRDLEHYIEGRFDERGRFVGRVVAFGQDLGERTFSPKRALSLRGRDRLGPFEFVIGTYEVEERRSTLTPTQHALLERQAEKYAGIFVFRDALRVMPYGRPEADFLGLEERRSRHAGRYFFAHRRSFGRIAITRAANPALRDKAGREGLVDNRAFREMCLLVEEFLIDAAKRYFGSDSLIREQVMPGIMERKLLQREAADKARLRRRKGIRQFLRENARTLEDAAAEADTLLNAVGDVMIKRDRTQAALISARAKVVRETADALRPPTPTSKMGDLEDQWRVYRDGYESLLSQLRKLDAATADLQRAVEAKEPAALVADRVREYDKALNGQLQRNIAEIVSRLGSLEKVWRARAEVDGGKFSARVGELSAVKVSATNLLALLELVDGARSDLAETFAADYSAIVSALDQLIEGIDLQGAVDISNETREELEDQLQQLHAVAQVGITVEIIGHEFETLESDVRRNLNRLAPDVRKTPAFEAALRAHNALADRLRFLTPMRIGGYRARETITGAQIADYMTDFFERTFREQGIEFKATEAFKKIAISDLPSRIYPVFVNLVNNAVYWSSQSEDRRVVLDFRDGVAVVADTGPGVDREDVAKLFGLFFTTRPNGRGIGLYLSRVNLGVAGHKIRYATEDDPHVLAGANFIIVFKGVKADG